MQFTVILQDLPHGVLLGNQLKYLLYWKKYMVPLIKSQRNVVSSRSKQLVIGKFFRRRYPPNCSSTALVFGILVQHTRLIPLHSPPYPFLDNNNSFSYVAATGLPETRSDHAELMARFAYECRYTVNKVVKQLEVSLG